MLKILRASAVAGGVCVVAILAAGAADAAALSFVSVKGADTGNCSNPATPCRTFGYALGQTTAGGEIKALDAGNYVPALINKSITISGVPGAGILRTVAGNTINISVGATGVVTLDGLTLNGFNKTAGIGVRVYSASRVVIRNCIIRNFSQYGIFFLSNVATKYLIENSLITNNGNGVYVDRAGSGSASGDINRVTITGSNTGLTLATAANARVSDSMIAHNALEGVYVSPLSSVAFRITRSVVTQNGTGVLVDTGAQTPLAETGHDNFIQGNTTDDINGALANVGTN